VRRIVCLLCIAWVAPLAQAGEAEGVRVYREAQRISFEVLRNATWEKSRWEFETEGYGSGLGFRADGWIAASAHQVTGAKHLTVICPDGVARAADRWLSLHDLDLAVIHVPDYDVPVAHFPDPDQVRVGVPVYALGRPKAFSHSLTRGIVSGLHRNLRVGGKLTEPFQDYVQTDAQANPGNSGGPLLDGQGRVVGMLVASLSATDEHLPGMSFAVPADALRAFGDRLIGEERDFQAGWLDTEARDCVGLPATVREELGLARTRGVLLYDVGEALGREGVRATDAVVSVGQVEVANWMHFRVLLARRRPGSRVTLRLERRGKPMTLEVTVAAWKDKPK
jgi:S1-C subfamily serine protease